MDYPAKKTKQLVIRMTEEEHSSLKMFCANLCIDMTSFVQRAIENEIVNESNKHEKKIVEVLYIE